MATAPLFSSLISFLNSKWHLNKREAFLPVFFRGRKEGLLGNQSLDVLPFLHQAINIWLFFCLRMEPETKEGSDLSFWFALLGP